MSSYRNPANAIGRWQNENDVDDAQLASMLSEKLGRNITPQGVRAWARRRTAPAPWLDALGLTPQDPEHEPPPERDNGGGDPRVPPPIALPFEPIAARAQIVMLYTMGGKGAARVLSEPAVETVWTQHAPQIADAYIEWAKTNATVARIIASATLGGPAGQVVLLHGSLLVSTLIVSGRIDTSQFVPPPLRPTEPEPATDDDEADDGDETTDEAPAGANGRRRRSGSVRSVD